MFTGIIEATAKVLQKTNAGLTLERPKIFDDIKIGCSIAVSGVCLTVTTFNKTSMTFDIVETTLQKTKLGSLKTGESVNLERAMKADGRFEGHIVTGHVEGVGRVLSSSFTPTPNPSSFTAALSPSPSPVPGEGDVAHVWKGVEARKYPPASVIANARSMRKEPTPAENVLWQLLRRRKVQGYYFRRQRPIGAFIPDFYCEELQLAIEVDGGVHLDKINQQSDEWRTEHLEYLGVRLLRFTNEDVLQHSDRVIAFIHNFILQNSVPLHPKGGGGRGGGSVAGAISLSISLPENLLTFVVLHGSVTLDGVALTVAGLDKDILTVALIPHTFENTTLGTLKKGDTVNIETDILAKYLQKHVR